MNRRDMIKAALGIGAAAAVVRADTMNLRAIDTTADGGAAVVGCGSVLISREELAWDGRNVAALIDAKCENLRYSMAAFLVDELNKRAWVPPIKTDRYYTAVYGA